MTRASVCVIAAGGTTPDLSGQTLQDYQVLRVTTEQEALERSGAQTFLWISATGRLAPQTLEECLWALQSADWVTWKDTGAAPPPSLRGVAGPLGISRRAMEQPDPKQGGEVRRLPWRCLSGEGDRHTQESIPAGGEDVLQTIVQTDSGSGLGRLAAHVKNSGVLSVERWREDPLGTALMAVPVRFKERINRNAGKEVFDLSGYQRFQPGSVYTNGRWIQPLRYQTTAKRGRKRIAAAMRHLGPEPSLLDLLGEIDRSKNEIVLLIETSEDNSWKDYWLQRSDWIFEAGRLVKPDEVDRLLLSLALNWKFDAFLTSNSAAAYRVLPVIQQRLPQLHLADLVQSELALDLPESTIDVLNYRVASTEALLQRLALRAPDGQHLRLIRKGLDVRATATREGIDGCTVGFAGPLEENKGALLLPAIAAELKRLGASDKTKWVIGGRGAHEARLRNELREYGAKFVGEGREIFDLADVWIVLTEDADDDWTLLEALSRGRTVVAVDAEGRKEIVSEDCGVLAPGGRDVEFRIAAALAELLSDAQRVKEFGAEGRRRVETLFSRTEARNEYRSFVRQLLGEASRIEA